MRKILFSFFAILFIASHSLVAAGYIATYSMKVSNPGAYIEAMDELMSSKWGKSFPAEVFIHFETFKTWIIERLFFWILLSEFNSRTLSFFFNFLDLSINRIGSPIVIMGILKFSQDFDVANWIIKSGPIPAGSPGEYIIFLNLDL